MKDVLKYVQVLLVFITITSTAQKIEPVCWGPGVWPHPNYCRLFSLCFLDPSRILNVVAGHLFLCPQGMGFSSVRNACVSSQLVAHCSYNSQTADTLLEESSAEHLLPSKNASNFHCAGHTVPYCDGLDALVVCSPNQGLIGAVNCSSRNNSGKNRCDKNLGKCVTVENLTKEDEELALTSTPGASASIKSSRIQEFPHQSRRDGKYGLPINDSRIGALPVTVIPYHQETHFMCKHSGKQCTDTDTSVILECSDTLQVTRTWNCSSFFPPGIFLDNSDTKVHCDLQQDRCIVYVKSKIDENFGEDNIYKMVRERASIKNYDNSKREITKYRCQHSGKQCTQYNSTLIIECSDDLEVLRVWDCISLFPSQTFLGINNAKVQCDSQDNSCVMYIGSVIQEEKYHGKETHTNKTLQNKELTDKLLYSCKHPGKQCSDFNNTVLLECSDALIVLNVLPCIDQFPLEIFKKVNTINAQCDSGKDKCVVYLGDITKVNKVNNTIQNTFMDNASLQEMNLHYKCKEPGIHCSTHNDSFLMECSRDLKLIHVWDCSSMIPSRMLEDHQRTVKCEPYHSTCILYIENDNTPQESNVKTIENRNRNKLSAQICVKPGRQCSVTNSSIILECSDDLVPLHAWDCASLFQAEALGDDIRVQCSKEDHRCIVLYLENVTQKNVIRKSYSNINIGTSDVGENHMRTEIHKGDHSKINHTRNNNISSQDGRRLTTHFFSLEGDNEEEKEVEDRESGEVNVSITTPLPYKDTIPQALPEYNDTSLTCRREGLQCVNNETIMDCPYDLSDPTFIMSCTDMIQLTHNDEGIGYCDNERSSCILKINQHSFVLKLSLYDIGEHSVYSQFSAKCSKGGLHCADNQTLVMCSGFTDPTDYAITCGIQGNSLNENHLKAYCDPQIESCVISTHLNESWNSFRTVKRDDINSREELDTIRRTDSEDLKISTTPRSLMSLVSTSLTQDDTVTLPTTFSTLIPTSVSSFLSKNLETEYQEISTESSFEKTSTLLEKDSPLNIKDNFICHTPGWQCLNKDTLVLCSKNIKIHGFLPCAEAYKGNGFYSYCDKNTSKCVIERKTTNPGL